MHNKTSKLKSERLSNFVDKFVYRQGVLSDNEDAEFIKGVIDKYNIHKKDLLVLADNVVAVDGLFLNFCEERSIEVDALAVDCVSITQNVSNTHSDPFVPNGIFKLATKDFSFIAASYEQTETSFMFVNKNDYDKYLALKKDFGKWLRQRDGIDVSVFATEDTFRVFYDVKWDNLFFEKKEELKKQLDYFFASKEKFIENKVPWKQIVFISGEAGSGKTTLLNSILFEYDLNPVSFSPIEGFENAFGIAINAVKSLPNALLIVEDVDVMIEQGAIDHIKLLKSIMNYNSSDGLVVVFTGKKIPKTLQNIDIFDISINIENVSLDKFATIKLSSMLKMEDIKSIYNSFDKWTAANVIRFHQLFGKRLLKIEGADEKQILVEAKATIKELNKINEVVSGTKSKKVGL